MQEKKIEFSCKKMNKLFKTNFYSMILDFLQNIQSIGSVCTHFQMPCFQGISYKLHNIKITMTECVLSPYMYPRHKNHIVFEEKGENGRYFTVNKQLLVGYHFFLNGPRKQKNKLPCYNYFTIIKLLNFDSHIPLKDNHLSCNFIKYKPLANRV